VIAICRRRLRIAFRSLPPDLLAVARLALIEQLPQAEIADALDVPIGTVKSRLFRAQRALARRTAPAREFSNDRRRSRTAAPSGDSTGGCNGPRVRPLARAGATGERASSWAWIDLGLVAAVGTALAMFPEWISLLAYHF
jgi:hypothetical protein